MNQDRRDFRYVEAPNYRPLQPNDPPAVFLAGGITGCPRWHDDAVRILSGAGESMTVLNPNRRDFPIHDPDAGLEQVTWEQHHLHLPGVITSMWFPACDASVTTQPIAQFEFGQALGERRTLLVGADPGYPRAHDVELMLRINRPGMQVHACLEDLMAAVVDMVRDINQDGAS